MRSLLTRGPSNPFASIAAVHPLSTAGGLQYSGPTGYPSGSVRPHTGVLARIADRRVLAFTVGSVVALTFYAFVLAAIWWSAAEVDTGPEPGGVFIVEQG
ncbi:MAG: hypothetical protein R3F61_25185 [Myxococcota bacterium]